MIQNETFNIYMIKRTDTNEYYRRKSKQSWSTKIQGASIWTQRSGPAHIINTMKFYSKSKDIPLVVYMLNVNIKDFAIEVIK